MRRFIALLLGVSSAALSAQPWPRAPDGAPSVTDPSIPLSYVGNDGSVSLGVNGNGQTEGQLLGVFARNNTRAAIGQLWWDRAGAGGVQADFNWLWGMDALKAREHPETATVARLTFALDQNADHDRKATLGFGIERREFSLEAYLARGISGARPAASTFDSDPSTITGTDAIGNFTQVETTTLETLFESKPYGGEAGLQLTHVFEPLALRVHGGASAQSGDGARASTFSAGLDTPLGTHGWGLSGLAEHVSRHGAVDGDRNEDRLSLYLRYEFGRHGSFVPTSQLEDPAWISRSMARPSTAHSRIVESHRVQRSQTVAVTHGPKQYTNHFPLLRNDSATVADGQPVSIDVLANDTDPDGDPLVLAAVTLPAHGTASIAGARIVYTPFAGFTGTDTFAYTAGDGRGGSASAQVTVTVAARPNQVPVARNDSATAAFGQPVTIGVLANDTDPDGNPLSISGTDTPQHGSAVVSGDVVIYTPFPGYSGSDRFTYTISDGHGGSASATVAITVAMRPNRQPLARDDSATTAFGLPVSIDVLANDTDPDGDALALIALTAPANGTAAISGGQVIYTPAAGFAGSDSFRYTISDGHGGSATATVTVTVAAQPDRAPVAVDDAAATPFAQPVTIAVLANDSDPDGDPLTIVATTPPANGTLVVSGNSVTYTPGAGFSGSDSFTYTINDGRGGSATATVTVTVAPAPNQPPVAVDDNATTFSGQPVTIPVLANDSDPDGDPLVITSVTAPASGTAVVSGANVIYTPAAGIVGTDRFAYTISDGRGGTSTAFVTVVIAPPPNRPPVAVDDTATTTVSQPVTIDVLANDSDPDGDPISVTSVTQPLNGTASVSPNGVIYAPRRGFTGADPFTYTISDGRGGSATATVTITVN